MFKIDKKFFGLLNDLFICFLHIPPENSTYSQNHGDQFENLTNDVLNYYDKGDILLCGDFNGRVSTAQDFVINDSISFDWNDDDEYCVDSCRYRNSLDKVTTARGRHIIDLCIQSRLRILNGRTLGDLEGSFTFHNSLGSSVIDYFITSDSFLEQIMFMKVHNFIKSLSDHCCLSVNFKVDIRADINKNDDTSKSLMPCPDKYIWDDKSITKFQNILSSNSISSKIKSFKDVDYNVCENSVNIATNDINDILYEAANLSLKKKTIRKPVKGRVQNKWYDRSLQELRVSIDYYSKLISFDPFNRQLRQKCFQIYSKYNRERKKKKRTYFQSVMNKLDSLEESNPKMFWKLLNSLKNDNNTNDSCIDYETWYNHFKSLNTIPSSHSELVKKLEKLLEGVNNNCTNTS